MENVDNEVSMSREQTAIIGETTEGTVRPHQPGESVFKAVVTEDIEWKPFGAFPPSVRLAVVVGQPSEPGPYVIRVRVPQGVKLMPQIHSADRIPRPDARRATRRDRNTNYHSMAIVRGLSPKFSGRPSRL